MRIVTWNCNGAFRKKFELIQTYKADIYIIQECENPKETNQKDYKVWSSNSLWIGDNKNKGLGIFAKDDITIESLDWPDIYKGHKVRHLLPCRVNNEFDLLGVWTHKNSSPNFRYIGQFWKYLQINKDRIDKIIIAGDFNSNTIWDEWDRWWNHSDVVRELRDLGIESLYHNFEKEEQGKETKPTLYFRKDATKMYHIDYVFASLQYLKSLEKLSIGSLKNWLYYSDHMPLFCEFN